MTRSILIALGAFALATSAYAQANPEVDKALLAAPRNQREATTVIKWKADGTYDTLRAGTNTLVCYDQSGQPTEKDGTRIKPEYGSVFWNLSGKDQETARAHMTVATPGATTASTGLPDHNKLGGAWIMGAGTSGAHIMIPGS
jgi:hypothetical protein